MAVYQGVRLRTSALPPATPLPRPRAARATTATSTTTPRLRPVGLLMAGILAFTMLGLVYLTQTLGANATSEVISGLMDEQKALRADLAIQSVQAVQALDEGEVVTFAREQGGLRALAARITLQAP